MSKEQLENACKLLSSEGYRIRLDKDESASAWVWQWVGGSNFAFKGWTDAAPKEVAFFDAVSHAIEMRNFL